MLDLVTSLSTALRDCVTDQGRPTSCEPGIGGRCAAGDLVRASVKIQFSAEKPEVACQTAKEVESTLVRCRDMACLTQEPRTP